MNWSNIGIEQQNGILCKLSSIRRGKATAKEASIAFLC